MNESLPAKTIRDIGALLVYFFELALRGTKTIINKVAPFVRPPDDIHVTADDGGQYTGVLIIQANAVSTGAVTRVGQEVPVYRPRPVAEKPWSSSSQQSDEDDHSRLAHWAANPADGDDEPWRR